MAVSKLQSRKKMRLQEYNYNSKGYYFITLCTKGKEKILGNIVGHDDLGVPQTTLSKIGIITEKHLSALWNESENILLDKYVIMPNHVHIILELNNEDENGATSRSVNRLSNAIGYLKRLINKEVGHNIWQSSFYDHIIRTEQDYLRIWEYIDSNPLKWADDEYFN